MARLTVEDLNQQIALAEKEVEIPELGGSVLVRALTAGRQAALLNGLLDSEGQVRDLREMNARLFSAAVIEPKVDVKQARLLSDRWPGPVWQRVMDVVNELNPTSKKLSEEVEAAAAAEFPPADE